MSDYHEQLASDVRDTSMDRFKQAIIDLLDDPEMEVGPILIIPYDDGPETYGPPGMNYTDLICNLAVAQHCTILEYTEGDSESE